VSIGILVAAVVLCAAAAALIRWWPGGFTRRGTLRLRDQADLLEQTYDAILIRSPGGRIEYWNRGAEALYGYSRDDALGQRSHDLLRTRPRAGGVEDMEATLLRDGRWEGVLEHTCSDGRHIVTESRQVLVRGLEGARILEANRDVTARVDAELERRRAADAVKGIVEAMGDALIELDLSMTITRLNAAAEAMLGRRRSELLGRALATAFPDPADAPIVHELARAAASGDPLAFDAYSARLNRWYAVRAHPAADGRLRVFLRDVSDQRESETRARAAADRREARLRRAFEIAMLGLLSGDLAAGTVTLSPELAAMLGAGERSRMTWRELAALAQEDDRPLLEAFWHASAAGAATAVDFRVRAPDGRTRWITMSGAALPGEDGEQLLAVAQDVTSRQESEHRLARAARLQAIGTLAGGMAHEVNNMMTAVIGFAGYARDALEPNHPARGDLGEVLRAAERAATVTQQVLAFSRQAVMQPVVLDLDAVVRGLEPVLRRLAGAHITVTLDLVEDLAPVRADRSQLEQMLINLVANARDAMPSGGALRISTSNRDLDAVAIAGDGGELAPGRYVALAVSDTGRGMSAETRARAFDPFFTTKPVGSGTGLGLPMVYGIMRQSGGDVLLDSEPGAGTTVTLLFPAGEAGAGGEAAAEERAAPGRETVLVVDDDALVRAIARRSLEQLGYVVREAVHGGDAIAQLDRDPAPDLVLCDLVMPERNGVEVGRHLAIAHPDVPILYMSGYAGDEMRQRGLLPPGSAFVAKPFTPASLARQVRWRLDPAEANGARTAAAGSSYTER
jgi:PAS domain S-box-containing protein